ncbi:tRNA (adenosine(37)-N6)-dimethylallyltransferase MiaA [Kocuria sp. p3-SID1433]|uniref:tRNA (adenosine(37)-N6)-dimethylallyltransferase MiaA n=1 Tax=unclassified Kocuria TaxID=2649579 RepID=UPI0021A30847|nr:MULTISPECIES: tRNA (adenosine(37)-N6)-dimethylallyltransferase MiaA [unclassified Kocuria]MCT1601817.1 tRNA (adenosine(37)-N6)-dimethylallyltransferase MiaA [Kocuria sp. p3-SID1428]MCT2179963.1 tRNA (adenosine(37)-N6)-dimethylallyltransferase MiaA [Kocuria sp. p3-SID1433]
MSAAQRVPAGQLPVIGIVGPTGTGKSDLAIELARRLDGEVVNADSMQFYRGMDIGTAKVSPAQRRSVPHHLLDVLDLHQEASVACFQQAARESFDEIRSRGRVPILVGGSGLYVRAALDEIDFPGTDPQVRARLMQELRDHGEGPLRRRLQEADPRSAQLVHDDRRLIRALEVLEVTGRPFTSFMPTRTYHQPAVQIGLDTDRAVLHQRLADRVEAMAAAGLQDEVARLLPLGLLESPTAGRALGYPQFADVVLGRADPAQAIEATTVATRQFARRQLTWFRADPRVHWLEAGAEDLPEQAQQLVEQARTVAGRD